MNHKRKDTKVNQTKQIIIETMFQLLEKKDFDNITTCNICSFASISRTTFYFHFEDKFDLMLHCILTIIEPFSKQLSIGLINRTIIMDLIQTMQCRSASLKTLIHYQGTWELKKRLDNIFIEIYYNYFRALEQQGYQFRVPIDLMAIYNSFGFSSTIYYLLENDSFLEFDKTADYLYHQMIQINDFYTIKPQNFIDM